MNEFKLKRVKFVLNQYKEGANKASVLFLFLGTLNYFLRPGDGKDHKKLVLEDDWDVLILLDACRFDYFKKLCGDYLNGDLVKAYSPGSGTAQWLNAVLTSYFENWEVFSSNPRINSKGVSAFGYKATAHFPSENIIDVWDRGWDEEKNTVRPEKVVNSVKDRFDKKKKSLIWFMQPHGPWIGESAVRLPDPSETGSGYDEMIIPLLRGGGLSDEDLKKMYQENLELALEQVKNLVEFLSPEERKIVVTSDHGELLGEYNSYLHYSFLTAPELREVPYFTVTGVK